VYITDVMAQQRQLRILRRYCPPNAAFALEGCRRGLDCTPFLASTVLRAEARLRRRFSMATATATRVQIAPDNTGLLNLKQSKETAQKASDLIQQDMQVGLTASHIVP
jgi:hypothetical protein